MIVHTLVFSFGDGRTEGEQDEFLAKVTDISLKSGLCTRVEARKHLPLPTDAHAPVFVASAVAQLLPEPGGRRRAVGVRRAMSFTRAEQQRSPYKVVWANTELFTPSTRQSAGRFRECAIRRIRGYRAVTRRRGSRPGERKSGSRWRSDPSSPCTSTWPSPR